MAIKQVVGLKRNQPPVRMNDMNASFFHGAHIERMRIGELDNQHTENIFVAEASRGRDLRQATQQFSQRRGARLRRMTGGK
jgi:hypothetical protein